MRLEDNHVIMQLLAVIYHVMKKSSPLLWDQYSYSLEYFIFLNCVGCQYRKSIQGLLIWVL